MTFPVPGVSYGGTTLTSPASLPGSTQMATIDASGNIATQAIPSAGVAGPGSSTDYAVTTYNGTGGSALRSQANLLVDSDGVKVRQTGGTPGTNETVFSQTATNLDEYPKNGGHRVISPNNNESQLIAGFYANNLTQGIELRYNSINNPGGYLRMMASGQNLGIYEGAPSAQLHTQSASTSKVGMKVTMPTSSTANAVEYNINNAAAVASVAASGRHTMPSLVVGGGTACDGILTATSTLDFGSISAGSTAELTISVTGATVGDVVVLGPPSSLESGLMASGRVSSANTVTVRLHNTTGSPIDPASATWRAAVLSF